MNLPILFLAAAGTLGLSFEKPLASGHLVFSGNIRRFDVALERPMDLEAAKGVAFELKCEDPSIVENIWLLFKSGNGYYRAAAARPAKAGEWTPTEVFKSDVRLYHWNTHVSLWEMVKRPADADIPSWSRIEGFQVVVAIDIDGTSADASVSVRNFRPLMDGESRVKTVFPDHKFKLLPGERRLLCTHVWGIDHDWDKTCRMLAAYGITDISPLMTFGGYVYYNSRFGVTHPLVAEYGDALRLCTDACHKYGMKCHPRRSCWSLGMRVPKETMDRFRRAGRLQVDFKGADSEWLCPTHPDNVQREIDGMLELAESGADGIMIDFFRFPGTNFCFCNRCRGLFEKRVGRKVEPWPNAVRTDPALAKEWSRYRCDTINAVFDDVSRKVKEAVPGLELSAAVAATEKGALDRGQDWPQWCRGGRLDVLYPMCYYSTYKMLKRDLPGLQKAVAGTKTKLSPMISFASGAIPFVEPAEFARQIETLRENGIRDLAFFRLQEYAPTCLEGVFDVAFRPSPW